MKRYTLISLGLCVLLAGCSAAGNTAVTESMAPANETAQAEVNTETEMKEYAETLENHEDGEHVLTAEGEEVTLEDAKVIKTGDDSSGDEADFYGSNSALFASDGGTLNLNNLYITTDGKHANAVFSYGEGTTVNISDSVIETGGDCSGGIMTTGGGTTNAENLTIHTTGNSSAAIRSDRGGGTVTVTGGSYTTDGKGSPVIYSTADITVSDAELTSTSSQGIVVEGKNSVTLNNVTVDADNTSKNSDKSTYYQAVMIYQSMSGDAAEGTASFTMNGGTLTNHNGDIFFVNNTTAEILLQEAEIINEADGVFLRAEAAGWGNEGSNGGHLTLSAKKQEINGDMVIDEISSLNLYLTDSSSFTGAVNMADGGEVYVELADGSTWTLTGNSYITSLTCDAEAINLNGYILYVNGEEYTAGTASEGEAITVTISSSGHGMPDGERPDTEGKEPPETPGDGQEPPAKPGEHK